MSTSAAPSNEQRWRSRTGSGSAQPLLPLRASKPAEEGTTVYTNLEYPQDHDGRSSPWQAGWNLCNSIMGSGILVLPYAVAQAGLLPAMAMMVTVVLLNTASVHLMLRIAQAYGITNYEQLCNAARGNFLLYVLAAFQIAHTFSSLISFLLILNNNLAASVLGLAGEAPTTGATYGGMILAALASLWMAFAHHISRLSAAGLVGVVSLATMLVLTAIELPIAGSAPADGVAEELIRTGDAEGNIKAFSTISVAFTCQHLVFQVYCSLEQPGHFLARRGVANGSLALSFIIMAGFAVLGYCTFWTGVHPDFFGSYGTPPSVGACLAQLAYCINVACTYPAELFVCRHTIHMLMDQAFIDQLFVQHGRPFHDLHQRNLWRQDVAAKVLDPDSKRTADLRLWITLALWLASLAGVALVKELHLGLPLDVISAASAAGLAYILPAICHLDLGTGPDEDRQEWFHLDMWATWLLLLFGIVAFVAAVVAAVLP